MPEKIIDLKDVHLSLQNRAVTVDILRGITLAIGAGEAVGIVGPSGSGKSSLLMIMTGLEKATGGSVRIAGHDFTALDEDGLARARGDNIGIVFQSFHLVPTMTAVENVALPLEFSGRADARARAKDVLSMVGLSHRLDHFPSQLSGGEQQRAAIARALAPNPKILFADEPTGNLDARTGEQIMDILFTLHKTYGATLVLITHDRTLAERCERIVTIEDGLIAKGRRELESVA